jgi:hypothetical protein
VQNATEGFTELHGEPERKTLQAFCVEEFPVLEL